MAPEKKRRAGGLSRAGAPPELSAVLTGRAPSWSVMRISGVSGAFLRRFCGRGPEREDGLLHNRDAGGGGALFLQSKEEEEAGACSLLWL